LTFNGATTIDMTRPPCSAATRFADVLNVLDHPGQDLEPELRMGHLPTPEHHGQLDLVPLVEETTCVADLELVVVVLDPRPELHLLDLDRVLFFPRFAGGPAASYLNFP
jgi:hypothetical protein